MADGGLKSFFTHWNKYVNGWIAAALVLPTAITWKGMPVYECQRPALTTLSALSCALILSFLYSSRDFIPKAKSRFSRLVTLAIPATLILLTATCGASYFDMLERSVPSKYNSFGDSLPLFPALNDAMKNASLNQVNDGLKIMVSYLGMMIFAECAFFFMAFREWDPEAEGADRVERRGASHDAVNE